MAQQKSSSRKPGASRPDPHHRRPVTRQVPASFLDKIPTKYHTPLYVGLILFSLLIFFGSVIFGGKTFAANDSISWLSFQPYLEGMAKQGEHPFWIPYIFSGMPAFGAYLVTGDRWWDLSMILMGVGEKTFGVLGNYWTSRVVLHYFIYGLGMYLLMRSKKAARSTSSFVAIAAMFSTWVIIYVMIGHNTKIMVLMTFPYIFMCLERLIDRWSFLYAGLLILAVHLMMEANHPQTAFYGACAVGVYLAFELIGNLIAKSGKLVTGVLRAGAVVALAGAFAYGMGIDRYSAVSEYTPYSTRGAAAIKPDPTKADQQTEDGGHGYKYATDWSFSPEETITYLVPSFYGFGKVQYSQGGGPARTVPTYFGQMPFTDAAHYMGIAVVILGIFGLWMNRTNRFVQALFVIGIFGLLLSFGRNGITFVYDFFYQNVPSFNKLRAPSQSLVLLEFVFPILAGFGIESLISMRKSGDNPKTDKTILYWAISFAGLMIVGLLGINVMKSTYLASIRPEMESAKDFIYSNMQSDFMWSAVLGTGVLALMYFFVRQRLNPLVFKAALITILVFDLWRVDYRPWEVLPLKEAMSVFEPTDIDEFLAKDTSAYRIMDLSIADHPNYASRQLHEHILGYHAAKMRSYQNLLDYTGQGTVPETPLSWNILNTKYLIAGGLVDQSLKPVFQSAMKQGVIVTENPNALPRAWFVNRVEVATDIAVLEKLGDTTYRAQPGHQAFDPRDVAYLKEKLAVAIDPVGYVAGTPAVRDTALQADSTAPAPTSTGDLGRGSVTVTLKKEQHLAFDVDAPGPTNNFLVISEINYPPGWRATIDGKPADIVQANYLLRGLVVPAGKHTIKMDYFRDGFETQKYISLGLNVAMLALIAFGAYQYRKRPAEEDPRHDAPEIEEEDV